MDHETKSSSETLAVVAHNLDALLGMGVRGPGSAANLPAVIRIVEHLEPAGGMDFPVFPPSYAGEGPGKPPPVYDLNGIEWGEVIEERSSRDGTKRIKRYVKRARHCTMDSPQSQANRTEIAFRDDPALRMLVPQAEIRIPRGSGFEGQDTANLLALPHRVADFRVRASNQRQVAAAAVQEFAKGNALPLLQFMPTSVVFGFWDSRASGYQHKHARILLTRIDAFGVVPCEKHAVYTGPYSKDECAAVVLGDDSLAGQLVNEGAPSDADSTVNKGTKEAKKWADRMAERGFTNALSGALGGVFVERIERLALISLTDIARVFCSAPGSGESVPDEKLTNAGRRYLLTLALLAEAYPRSTGSYRLRSGCELFPSKVTIDLRGAGTDSEVATALLKLCEDRELLIEVAAAACRDLGIQATPVPDGGLFDCTVASLKEDLESDRKPKSEANGKRRKAGKPAATASAPSRDGSMAEEQPS